MNEAYLKSDIRKRLKSRGFLVINLADKSRMGLPDTLAIIDGRGLFLELKYVKLAKQPAYFKQFSKLGKRIQVVTAREIEEKHFPVRYVIIYDVGDNRYVTILRPSTLEKHSNTRTPIPIFLEDYWEWAGRVHPSDYSS